ncbi:hypothetical protein [Halobacterium litoreum]|uniref:DUF8054 domain-containing protein n=1 Tax=Halobacterium litoreum TaxID=2039234 RepID=A0ABD5NG84_9EURY|nr:hypothetical protein [Halobacterium litoreum]UHH12827.1 hypothetical protein LT972_11745 [Halobacterium litoreum]
MSDLTFARVVADPADALSLALDRELTGYAVFTPQDALLFDEDGAGVVAFDDGVPTHVEHTGTGRGGASALADFAAPGPLRVECYAGEDGPVPRTERCSVAPDTPAARLAGDDALAERTREAADVDAPTDDVDAVEAFLADEQKVEAIRERAREEAAERAEEWGFEEFADE